LIARIARRLVFHQVHRLLIRRDRVIGAPEADAIQLPQRPRFAQQDAVQIERALHRIREDRPAGDLVGLAQRGERFFEAPLRSQRTANHAQPRGTVA